MSLISNLNSKNDDLIELNKDSFKNNSFNFNIPKNNGMKKGGFIDDNLFNKKKLVTMLYLCLLDLHEQAVLLEIVTMIRLNI